MIEAAVGIGVIISLVFAEILGASAGGIVVPGYIALYLDRPLQVLGTLLVSFITLLTIKLVSKFTLLYGKRRMVLSILLGFIFGWLSRNLNFGDITVFDLGINSIGYIVPGLIANWMERQGVIKTLSVMILAAILVRLLLIVISGGEVLTHV
ncbi:MAG: poly-gamma-glutamate biosynthesis protein PgsC [Candidatus Cloacimonadota bacterium]|nr:MAG: poly-gamma-glutamate biosynthesis protein PgsC [Candidatus Cloacimonadota bacterium]